MAISMKSPDQLKSVSDERLARAYAHYKKDNIKNELLARNLFNEKEWEYIETGGLFTGMSKMALFASLPNLFITGMSKFDNYGLCEVYTVEFTVSNHIYVYEDKVVGWQMW